MSIVGAVSVAVACASVVLAALAPRVEVPPWRHPDAAPLALALPGWSLVRLEVTRALAVASAAIALAPLGLLPLAVFAAVVPSAALRWRMSIARERAAARSLDVLQAVHAALRGGIPLALALRLAIERSDPLAGDPFVHALEAFDLNVPLDDALRAAAATAHDRRVAMALEALALLAAEQLPASRSATVVASVVDRLTFERRLAEEVRARSGGVRAQIVLLALLVPALALYLTATMAGLRATLATPLGTHVLIPAAALLELAGIVASRGIVRGVAR
ncbi:MAG TPA: hypothetical protein VI814_11920 [Candidatus Limnocylindria bacterium]